MISLILTAQMFNVTASLSSCRYYLNSLFIPKTRLNYFCLVRLGLNKRVKKMCILASFVFVLL